MFENPRRGKQARNLTTNVPKILDLKSSSEQVFSENGRWVPLAGIYLPFLSEEAFYRFWLVICLFVCLFAFFYMQLLFVSCVECYAMFRCRILVLTWPLLISSLCLQYASFGVGDVYRRDSVFSLSVLKECREDLIVFALANDSFQVETVDVSFIFLFHFILNMIFVRCFEASKNFPWREW